MSAAVKAAMDVLRDLRNEVRMVLDYGGVTASSYARDVDGWYTPANAFLSIGPPVERMEQLVALIEARLPEPDNRSAHDELTHRLRGRGEIRSFVMTDPDGGRRETGGLEVDPGTHRVV